ncbi:hypothetical protein UYSO10_1931 [Kosakonia radicincitans]|nr:hypothetical protein UYSO10_1931 [Kosakonia radicincitans]
MVGRYFQDKVMKHNEKPHFSRVIGCFVMLFIDKHCRI